MQLGARPLPALALAGSSALVVVARCGRSMSSGAHTSAQPAAASDAARLLVRDVGSWWLLPAACALAVHLMCSERRSERRRFGEERERLAEDLIRHATASALQPLQERQIDELRRILLGWFSCIDAPTWRRFCAKIEDAEFRRITLLRCRIHLLKSAARRAAAGDSAPPGDGAPPGDSAPPGDGTPAAESNSSATPETPSVSIPRCEPRSEAEHTCKVCFTASCNAMLVPCGHMVCCLECVAQLRQLTCPVCACAIRDVMRAFTC